MSKTNLPTIDTLRKIVENQNAKVMRFEPSAKPVAEPIDILEHWGQPEVPQEQFANRLLVDMQTAHAMVLLYDAMLPEFQVKAEAMMRT